MQTTCTHLLYLNQRHTRPTNEIEWNYWWICKDSWEEPNLSRTTHGPVWTAIEQFKLFITLDQRVERILIQCMLPQYKKNVPCLVVGTLDKLLWESWIRTISNGAPFSEVKQRIISVPSHLPKKQKVPYKHVTWSVFMPKLSEVHSQWWWKKWVNGEDGRIFRAWIIKLSLAHNSLTEIITASLDYKTEFYCDEKKEWRPI